MTQRDFKTLIRAADSLDPAVTRTIMLSEEEASFAALHLRVAAREIRDRAAFKRRSKIEAAPDRPMRPEPS